MDPEPLAESESLESTTVGNRFRGGDRASYHASACFEGTGFLRQCGLVLKVPFVSIHRHFQGARLTNQGGHIFEGVSF